MNNETKLKVIAPGDFPYRPGDEVTTGDVLAIAGRALSKACMGDALGDHLFEGADGKRYGVFFEAHLDELDPEHAAQLLEDLNAAE